MQTSDLILVGVTLLFSAFFSGMEIAFISSSKLKIELENKLGKLPARFYSQFLDKQSKFIGAMLVGNNIALVVYGILMAKLLESLLYAITSSEIGVLLLQTLISTLLVLISAEFLPKTIFRINPNRTLNLFSFPVAICYVLLYPVVIITISISNIILKLAFKASIDEEKPVFGKIDLDHYLKQATETIEDVEDIENEVQIFRNALDFANIKVRECMIPRTEIIALEMNESVDVLTQNFVETGLSKILIYKENIDNIIGYVHSFDLFKKPEAIKNIIHPIAIVPETMASNEALNVFIKKKRSIAVVVDEFGGTAGIIALEDLVEVIFGEIEDEHDTESSIEIQLSENKYHLSARLELSYLNTQFKLLFEESEEYETLAGYIIHFHEDIPSEGEKIELPNYHIEILKVTDNRIEEVYLTKLVEH